MVNFVNWKDRKVQLEQTKREPTKHLKVDKYIVIKGDTVVMDKEQYTSIIQSMLQISNSQSNKKTSLL